MASVIGCNVVSMENYRDGVDEGNDLDSIDFDLLIQNLEVILSAPLGFLRDLYFFLLSEL